MYAHVLVGTDGLPTGTHAVEAAALLAQAHHADLTVAHAFRPTRHAVHPDAALPVEMRWMCSPGSVADGVVQDAVRRAQAVVCGGVGVVGRAEPGSPVPVLLALINELDVDAVVIGNADIRGRGSRSVGRALSRQAACDVVIVDTAGRSERRRASRMGPRAAVS